MTSPEEKAEVSKQEQGGARALAQVAAEILESYTVLLRREQSRQPEGT